MHKILLAFIIFKGCCAFADDVPTPAIISTPTKPTFLYFAYGSNLWSKRMTLLISSAVYKGIAKLDGYRLDFYTPPSINWNGSPATIVEDDNQTTWGALYEIDIEQLPLLDLQENIHYKSMVRNVVTDKGEIVECRMYKKIKSPPSAIDLTDPNIPYERKPSKSYIDVIVRGAEESKLPEKYIEFLRKIVHNGRKARPQILAQLFNEMK